MSAPRDARLYLETIAENLALARRFASEASSEEELLRDLKSLYAIVRALEVVGEATKRVPDEVKQLAPELPWREMAGMRDKLIHGYDTVDVRIVLSTVHQRIPEVEPLVRSLLERIEPLE